MTKCPYQSKIDPYLLGKLGEAESAAFEDHYFNCPPCFQETFARNELVDVIRDRGAILFPAEAEPRPVRRETAWDRWKSILTPRPWAAVAAAAALILVVFVGVIPRSTPVGAGFSPIDDATVRGASVEAVSPAGVLARAPESFSWKGVAGAAEYAVTLFRGADIVWTAASADIRIAPPEQVRAGLESGTAYVWQVKAYSAQGTLLASSARTAFTIAR